MLAHGWTVEELDGLSVVRCEALDAIPGVRHGFSTRRGGEHGDFDPGPVASEDPVHAVRRARLLSAVGLDGQPVLLRQVHGAVVVRAGQFSETLPEADAAYALAGDAPPQVPLVRTADCLPILLASRDGQAVAAVHAGWRGTAAGVSRAAVRALGRAGVEPGNLVAASGPAIGRCCYEVGPEVVEAVVRATGSAEVATAGKGENARIDLFQANRLQLLDAGLPASSIHGPGPCTACLPDLFFSYRREGRAAGRMVACIGCGVP